jgi:hypothetical protein
VIKAVAMGTRKVDDSPVATIALGLSDENLRRLREGMPIVIDGRDITLPSINIVIFSGRTEEDCMRQLKEGLLEEGRESQ